MPERMYSSPGSKCHLQLISALNLCSRVTMADSKQFDALAGRLRKMSLTDADSPEALEAVMKMTLSELSQCPIDFGKTHLGKKFKDMVGETKYLTWFAETYKHSKRPTSTARNSVMSDFFGSFSSTWIRSTSR